MSKGKTPKPIENLVEVEHALTTAEMFFEKNSKIITIIFGTAVVIALLLLATHRFYSQPREAKSREQMYVAIRYFEKDSFNLAVNGDGNYPGFLDIIDSYGSTKAGKLARCYMGLSDLYLGKFQEAIDYLENYKTDDFLLAPEVKGATGDAYCELGNREKAVKLYMEAAELNPNAFTSPKYYLKAGNTYEILGSKDKALAAYKVIKDRYAESEEGKSIDKYIARLMAK
ncbi:MAG: tetratricopeptide repeat protein [Bacteroidia bacterium]|nr:tetratricopeptide repeat protein [Bacteroidia bacterium]